MGMHWGCLLRSLKEHVIKLVQQEGLFAQVTKAARVSDLTERERERE